MHSLTRAVMSVLVRERQWQDFQVPHHCVYEQGSDDTMSAEN